MIDPLTILEVVLWDRNETLPWAGFPPWFAYALARLIAENCRVAGFRPAASTLENGAELALPATRAAQCTDDSQSAHNRGIGYGSVNSTAAKLWHSRVSLVNAFFCPSRPQDDFRRVSLANLRMVRGAHAS
jgi:hypothetical protein